MLSYATPPLSTNGPTSRSVQHSRGERLQRLATAPAERHTITFPRSAVAMAFPIPLPAPVTSAILFLVSPFSPGDAPGPERPVIAPSRARTALPEVRRGTEIRQ
jgi:hypothetical protein